MCGDDDAPNKMVSLDIPLLARAALLLQKAVAERLPKLLKPLGCSVDDRGFKCDFMPLKGRWPGEDEARELESAVLKLEEAGVDVREAGSPSGPADELLSLLGYTAEYLVGGFKARLEPGVKPSNSRVGAVKILNISAHNPAAGVKLVRIIGVAFESREGLEEWLRWFEEASKRDHRVLGQKLKLFSFHEEIGPGLVIYHPRGQVVREELIKFIREVNAELGYEEVYTPHVLRSTIWKVSGHYYLYRDKMVLARVEGEEYGIKPMNCPGHILVYKSETRSYRDLPVRLSEFGTVYRWEKRGELYGLLRVRGFTQDDGHAFLREDQVKDEIKAILKAILRVLETFGFKGEDVRMYLSTMPEEHIGTEEMWAKATEALRGALDELGLKYEVMEGEGAFYGPKIDVHFRDSLGRWWQCSTIQVDFALPERFGLEYVDRDGSRRRPVMIHRAILGSVERFMAILIENFAGRLPTWLSPIQARVIPVRSSAKEYAAKVAEELRKAGIRADADLSSDTPSKKIRRAYGEAIPYILLVGPREARDGTVTVRARGNRQVAGVPLKEFIERVKEEIRSRSLTQRAIEELAARG